MKKLPKLEEGFSLVEVLLVLLVVLLIAGCGYYIYSRSKTTPAKTTTATTKAAVSTNPVFNPLPAGWVEYKNDTNGLRVGYPKKWGDILSPVLQTPSYLNDTENMQGRLIITFSKKDDTSVITNKYGATIKPSSDGKSWVVAEENPASVDGYKVGDSYKPKEVKVSGGTAMDITYTNEDCTFSRWLIDLKSSYALVSIPDLCPVNMQPISAANKTAYDKLVADFLNTITIY